MLIREEKGEQTQRMRNEDAGRGQSDAGPFARKRDVFGAQEAANPGFSV